MKYQFLSGALLVLALALRSTNAITCKSCSSFTDEANVETGDSGCADGSNSKTVDSNDATQKIDFVCSTVFSNVGASFTVARGAESGTSKLWTNNTKYFCTSQDDTTTCYCNEANCNSVAVGGRSYECYYCQSSNYFDNGCGSELDTSSSYVKTVTGCNACLKTVTIDSDDLSIRYSRGCARNFIEYDECFGEEKTSYGRTCACKDNKCNSAAALKSTSVFAAVIFLSIFKLVF